MSVVIARERALYQEVLGLPDYEQYSPGAVRVPMFREMAAPGRRATILDAGCGTGQGALALVEAGFSVRMCDLTDAGLLPEARALPFSEVCLWHPLHQVAGYVFGGKFDYVYCCDVLEHLPTEYTMLAVRRMLDVARHGVFLNVSLRPDNFGAWVGKALHQTVQPFTWWRDALNAIGRVQEARDCFEDGVFYVVPR